jgi:HD-GYP domain-containing protein (c-di-GMP phosphodiesterase class II)
MMSDRRVSIRYVLMAALIGLTVVISGIMMGVAYQRTSRLLNDSAMEKARRATQDVAVELDEILHPVRMGVDLLAVEHAEGIRSDHFRRMTLLTLYVSALKSAEAAVSFYAADKRGNFFLVRRLYDAEDRRLFDAPPETAYIVQTIERYGGSVRGRHLYFDTALHRIGQRDSKQYLDFDPRTRPWFQMAEKTDDRTLTDPYMFYGSHIRGISIARRASGGQCVTGADVRFDTLSNYMNTFKITENSRLLLLDRQGVLFAESDEPAAEDSSTRQLSSIIKPLLQKEMAGSRSIRVMLDGRPWQLWLMPLPPVDRRQLYLQIVIPEHELFAAADQLRRLLLAMAAALAFLVLPLTFWLSRRITRPLVHLVRETESIRHFDFGSPITVHSRIAEVDALAMSLRTTKSTLAQFMTLLANLSGEKNFHKLLPELLSSTIRVAQVDGGFLLLSDVEGLRIAAGLWQDRVVDLSTDTLPDGAFFSCDRALRERRAIVDVAREEDSSRFGTPAKHALTVPLFNRDGETIGVLALLHAEAFTPDQQSFIEALSGFAAVALETRELIAMQKALFDAFIKMMADAIDAKSPYTGGHCTRVPEIAHMLAQAVCQETQGRYADFSLSEDQWEALHIAAWLHDCGKVTTPEYVVDKATKLETIYDRIHEVRMRFEVLSRDADIRYFQQVVSGTSEGQARADRDAEQARLHEDFAFVATCNEGGEFMAPEKIERLRRIGSRTWRRTFSDRLGISAEERRRKEVAPEPGLPVDEPLLSDKPEHLLAHDAEKPLPGEGNALGFTMRKPDFLYDRGELKNLSIARGTLAEEERYKINEHIIQTIAMLSALPFPRHLSQVPEIAGGHHERMDGKGYPRGLTGEKMSPLARVMAIADVFEALTASDRPYKSGKTLSQSLNIMQQMVEEGHLEPELFRIFITSGIATHYARRFLKAEQIDVEDAQT